MRYRPRKKEWLNYRERTFIVLILVIIFGILTR